MNVGQDTTRGNGDSSQKSVEFFVVLDGKGNVARHDTRLLVVTGGVSGKFQNLGAQVLQDSGKVDRGTGSHTGGVLSLTQVTSDTTDRELKTSLGRGGGRLLLSTASLSCASRNKRDGVLDDDKHNTVSSTSSMRYVPFPFPDMMKVVVSRLIRAKRKLVRFVL